MFFVRCYCSPNNVNKLRYKQQRNYCVNLTRRVKKNYYSNLDTNKVNDNKKFWDTVKPCFSEKNTSSKRITLVEQDNIITDEKPLAEMFNAFFSIGTRYNKTRSEGNSIMTLNELDSETLIEWFQTNVLWWILTKIMIYI